MEPDVSFSPMKLSSDGSGRVGTLSYQSELPTHFSSRAALVSWLCEKKTWASFRCVANGSVPVVAHIRILGWVETSESLWLSPSKHSTSPLSGVKGTWPNPERPYGSGSKKRDACARVRKNKPYFSLVERRHSVLAGVLSRIRILFYRFAALRHVAEEDSRTHARPCVTGSSLYRHPTSGFLFSGATFEKRETSGFKASHVAKPSASTKNPSQRRRIIPNRIAP
ncbi:hypothetical protein VNO80_33103 [Phaseolus coccineus]|uniref:Uncharacterized protein n=1 Tax=Phaseolus coccineus TaxID=3886 RepID=A0AAN9QCL4_PHACN